MKYLIMVLVTMLCGCGSTLHLAKNRLEKSAVQLPVSKVFVSNPEKAYELELLEKSKIYQLVSKDKAEAILTIDRAGPVPFCANALIGSFLVLGTIPVVIPQWVHFRYSLTIDDKVVRYEHRVPAYRRISIWERLIRLFSKDEVDIIASGLKKTIANKLGSDNRKLP